MTIPNTIDKPTRDEVARLLSYDPGTGVFTWLPRPRSMFRTKRHASVWNAKFAGTIAGSVCKNGYRYITINYKAHRACRIAVLLQTGDWPSEWVDHIDGVTTNDAWVNLRAATASENGSNRPKQKNNTSGYKGVSWSRRDRCWYASIGKDRKSLHLGTFQTAVEASLAYELASKKIYGEFAYNPSNDRRLEAAA